MSFMLLVLVKDWSMVAVEHDKPRRSEKPRGASSFSTLSRTPRDVSNGSRAQRLQTTGSTGTTSKF